MFDYGKTVRILSNTDRVGEIVGIRTISSESELIDCKVIGKGLGIGVAVYLVEFPDGKSSEYTENELTLIPD